MSVGTYRELLQRVQDLTTEEQLELLEQLAALVRRRAAPQKVQSILQLRGLGKEIWHGVDAQQYVNEERASWDG